MNHGLASGSIASFGPTALSQPEPAAEPRDAGPSRGFAQFQQETVTAVGCNDFKISTLGATAERLKSVDRGPRLELLLLQETARRKPELSADQLADLLNFVLGDPYPEMTRINPARRLRFFRFHVSAVKSWRAKPRRLIENWCDGQLERDRVIPERPRGGGRKPSESVPRQIAAIMANARGGAW